jgi:type VI secretion system secreted protein Hcp
MNKLYLRNIAIIAAVATTLFCPISAKAAVDMFLKLNGINGESKDATHRNEIDVLAWSWGESSGTALTKKGLVPNACIQDISLTKYIDNASPDLIMKTVTGQLIGDAKLTVRKAGTTPLEYLVITMSNVTATSYSTGGSGGEDRLTENVTLHFGRMVGTYTKQDPITGAPAGTVLWDISGQSSTGCQ